MNLIALIILCGTVMATVVSHYILQRYTAEEEMKHCSEENSEKEKFILRLQRSSKMLDVDGKKLTLNENLACFFGNYGLIS